MTVTLFPSHAKGIISAPPSKSMSHRMLIAAGLAEGESILRGLAPSEDVLATLDCLQALSADCRFDGSTAIIRGIGGNITKENPILPCRECGSTLRFFIPIAATSREMTTFTGSKTLLARPLSVYETIFRKEGLPFLLGENSLTVGGILASGNYTVKGNISSQFVSGLLFALPLLPRSSKITLIPPIESRSYINLTLAVLKDFGIRAAWESDTVLTIDGNQHYTAHSAVIEGDDSNAAFFHALAFLGDDVEVIGLNPLSQQGDRIFLPYAAELKQGCPTLSLADCPDLAPILFVLAALLNGACFTDTARLAIKESDRAAAMKQELEKCGIRLEIGENSVTVYPHSPTPPTSPLSSHNDHRIVMALAILLTRVGGTIMGAEAVKKSMPDFFKCLASLGIAFSKDDPHET